MEIALFWIIFSIVVGVAAGARGRSGGGWCVLALIISPVLALILLVLLPNLKGRPTPETHVKCPDCAELVLRDALVCKHCGCRLVPRPLDTEVACPHCGGFVPRVAWVCKHCNRNTAAPHGERVP